jgi:hypothetical protein
VCDADEMDYCARCVARVCDDEDTDYCARCNARVCDVENLACCEKCNARVWDAEYMDYCEKCNARVCYRCDTQCDVHTSGICCYCHFEEYDAEDCYQTDANRQDMDYTSADNEESD